MAAACKGCKRSLTLKEASIQTDDLLNTKRSAVTSPPPLRSQKSNSPSKIYKIEQNKGDTDEVSEGFTSDSEDFSIEMPYVRRSLGRDETVQLGFGFCKDELTESTRKKSYYPVYARQTPDPKKHFETMWTSKSKTPAIHGYKGSKGESFGESYEKIVDGCKGKDSLEFRECFKQLVYIEKKSLQETLWKKLGNRRY